MAESAHDFAVTFELKAKSMPENKTTILRKGQL